MTMIKGITVYLHEYALTGTDILNNPVYEETTTAVDNVLVSPASEQEIVDTINLTGRKAVYTLALPKGTDVTVWNNAKVEFFDQTFRTIGMPVGGIEDLIPLDWNYKVRCEVYE